jgi:hypothetical protein
MARLSVEHYRANANMTPDHGRKSSRFRDIFKSRSSLSPSTASITDKSTPGPSSPPPPISPTTPTVKHGFEKIGLLPSERSSLLDVQCELENHGGARVAEALKRQGEERKIVDVPHNLDTALSNTGAVRVERIAKEATENQQSPEANVIADALKNTLLDRQDIQDNKDVPRNGTTSLRQLQIEKDAEPSRSSFRRIMRTCVMRPRSEACFAQARMNPLITTVATLEFLPSLLGVSFIPIPCNDMFLTID